MHVPYSMDDSEPDLYGSLGGHGRDHTPGNWDEPYEPPSERFYSETEVRKIVRDMMIQRHEAMDRLRNDLMRARIKEICKQ